MKRYHNNDGTLTDDGKKRYHDNDGNLTDDGMEYIYKNARGVKRPDGTTILNMTNRAKVLDDIDQEMYKTKEYEKYANMINKTSGRERTELEELEIMEMEEIYDSKYYEVVGKHIDKYAGALLKDLDLNDNKTNREFVTEFISRTTFVPGDEIYKR